MDEVDSMDPMNFDSSDFDSPEPSPPPDRDDLPTPTPTPPLASAAKAVFLGDDSDDNEEDPKQTAVGKVAIEGKYSSESDTITATWTFSGNGAQEAGKDWVGLFIYGRLNNKSYTAWDRVPESGNTLTFSPKYKGYYDLRYFVKGNTEPISRSERILVGREKPIDIRVTERGSLQVDFSVFDEENASDWIGLYKTSTKSNRGYIQALSPKDGKGFTEVAMKKGVVGECHLRYFFYDSTSYKDGFVCSGYSKPFLVDSGGCVTIPASDGAKEEENRLDNHIEFNAEDESDEESDSFRVKIHAAVRGNNVQVKWEYNNDLYSPSDKDTVTLIIYNRVDSRSFQACKDVKTQTAGNTCEFELQHRGYYEVRYHDCGIRWLNSENRPPVARSAPFLYGPPAPLGVEDRPAENQIRATCLNKSDTSEHDVVALYRADERSNSKYIDHKRVGRACKDDSLILFDRPRESGAYELRYFYASSWAVAYVGVLSKSYFCSGRSDRIVVNNENSITLSLDEANDVLTVSYHCQGVEPSAKDWIGIFESADDKAAYVKYQYCAPKDKSVNSGSNEFKLSEKCYVGKNRAEWEIRYIKNNDSAHPVARKLFASVETK